MDHYDCIKPLLYIQQCLGIGAFYAKKQNDFKPHEYYTKPYDFLITLFFMGLVIVGRIVKEYLEFDSNRIQDCFLLSLLQITALYETYFGIFLFFVTYIMAYKHRFVIMEAHTMIEEVDKTLHDFQYEIPYRKIRNYSSIAVLVLVLLEFLAVVISEPALLNDYIEIVFALLECIPNIIYTVAIGVFINFMFCLRYRFQAINDLLIRNFKQYVLGSEKERILNEQEFDLLTKTHEKLCDVSDSVSEAFSTILFCASTYLFVLIIIEVFIAMRMFVLGYTYENNLFVSIGFLLSYILTIYSIKLAFLVLSTELVISEASKTHAFVHKSINCYSEDSIRNKLTIFLMQLINRKPSFTACGLFEINLPLLFSMVGALFTYVIILIQFDQSDKGCIDNYLLEKANSSSTLNSTITSGNITDLMANDTTIDPTSTVAILGTDFESKIYSNITEILDNFTTSITNNFIKLMENGKQFSNLSTNLPLDHLPATNLPSFTSNLSRNSSDELSHMSWKVMSIIQNITDVNLLKNISSNLENLLQNN